MPEFSKSVRSLESIIRFRTLHYVAVQLVRSRWAYTKLLSYCGLTRPLLCNHLSYCLCSTGRNEKLPYVCCQLGSRWPRTVVQEQYTVDGMASELLDDDIDVKHERDIVILLPSRLCYVTVLLLCFTSSIGGRHCPQHDESPLPVFTAHPVFGSPGYHQWLPYQPASVVDRSYWRCGANHRFR